MTQAELGKIAGVTDRAVASWEKGIAEPRMGAIQKIADHFGISKGVLIEDAGLEQNRYSNRIPVLGSVPAGIPIEAIEDIVDYEDIPGDWLDGDSEYFALRVKGDSMSPKYIEGDTVIIKKQSDCESGQDCVAYINGYDATLKKITKVDNGVIVQPINPNYETKAYYDNSVKIAGVVVELRRKI